MNLRNILVRYQKVTGLLVHLQSPMLLFVRLYWGWQFAYTGWGHLHNLDHFVTFFTSLNIPFPAANAVFVGLLELIGGVLLGIGLFSRPVALLLAGDMLVAYWTADREALFSFLKFPDPGKFYAADPYTFLFASVMILVFGAGIYALDHLIFLRYGVQHDAMEVN